MAANVYRDGAVLVVEDGAVLPDSCVKCNRPGTKRNQTFYWHAPALYLLVLINILVYAVVALVVRKKATVDYGLCEEHRSRREFDIAIAWVVGLSGVAVPFVGLMLQNGPPDSGLVFLAPYLYILSPVLILGGLVWGAVKVPVMRAVRIDAHEARLKGPGEAFLVNLPSLPVTLAEPGAVRIT